MKARIATRIWASAGARHTRGLSGGVTSGQRGACEQPNTEVCARQRSPSVHAPLPTTRPAHAPLSRARRPLLHHRGPPRRRRRVACARSPETCHPPAASAIWSRRRACPRGRHARARRSTCAPRSANSPQPFQWAEAAVLPRRYTRRMTAVAQGVPTSATEASGCVRGGAVALCVRVRASAWWSSQCVLYSPPSS